MLRFSNNDVVMIAMQRVLKRFWGTLGFFCYVDGKPFKGSLLIQGEAKKKH